MGTLPQGWPLDGAARSAACVEKQVKSTILSLKKKPQTFTAKQNKRKQKKTKQKRKERKEKRQRKKKDKQIRVGITILSPPSTNHYYYLPEQPCNRQ